MRIIDLSKPLFSGMPVYPGDPTVSVKVEHTHANDGWELRKLSLGTHTGTHVDAYSHMHQGKASIEAIPLERFFGPAQVVEKSGMWPEGIGLFFTEEIGVDCFERLVKSNPNFVGGQLTEALERALLQVEIITYTDLVNLEQIPVGASFTFYGFPLKIKEGDGSPVRAVAIIE